MAKARRKQAETADQDTDPRPAKAARQPKAERKQAKAARQTKAERKQTKAARQTKAQRKQARAAGGRGSGRAGAGKRLREDASAEERIEWRLARIEETVATQAERSEELLEKVDEMLHEPPDSPAAANAAGPDGRAD